MFVRDCWLLVVGVMPFSFTQKTSSIFYFLEQFFEIKNIYLLLTTTYYYLLLLLITGSHTLNTLLWLRAPYSLGLVEP